MVLALAADMFRIAVMGDLTTADIERLLAECQEHFAIDARPPMVGVSAPSDGT